MIETILFYLAGAATVGAVVGGWKGWKRLKGWRQRRRQTAEIQELQEKLKEVRYSTTWKRHRAYLASGEKRCHGECFYCAMEAK